MWSALPRSKEDNQSNREAVMAKERKYFTFYRSFYEQISSCEDKNVRLEMYEVFLDYAFNRKEPDFKKGKFSELTRFFWMGAKPVLDKNWQLFENGNQPKESKTQANVKQTSSKPNATPSIDKDNRKRNKEKDKDIEREGEKEERIFCPPSLKDLSCYYLSVHGDVIESSVAKKFINYYAARGWRMGNVMMTDWKAAFDYWCEKEQEFGHNNEQRPTPNGLIPTQQVTGFKILNAGSGKSGTTNEDKPPKHPTFNEDKPPKHPIPKSLNF